MLNQIQHFEHTDQSTSSHTDALEVELHIV